jgi:pyridoxamine 5'-phosphate oxidase family protein
VSKFTEAELEYLQAQRLGRLATVNERGEPQVAAVGFRYNPEFDTIDIGGYDMANTQKFRNIARNGLASFLVDDVQPPWKTRSIEIRGHAQALPEGGQFIAPNRSPALIRITPRRIIFWDATTDPPVGSKRTMEWSNQEDGMGGDHFITYWVSREVDTVGESPSIGMIFCNTTHQPAIESVHFPDDCHITIKERCIFLVSLVSGLCPVAL